MDCSATPVSVIAGVPISNGAVKVPNVCKEELTTAEFNAVPLNVPAGAITAFVLAAVIKPLPFTVKLGIAVDDPKLPVLLLTVAKVPVMAVVPLPVKSPERVMLWLAVR